jgi:hypothetical protein
VTAKGERCGNDGAEESVESQKQAFPSFHVHLGNLANGGRDSHIPTAPTAKADGKVENQKQVSHFPTAPRIDREHSKSTHCQVARLRLATWQKSTERRSSVESRFSGSSRIGMEVEFQAHAVLDSIPDFRLISGLENAAAQPLC